MKLTRTTLPTQLPVGLDEVKRRLDYTGTDIDQTLTEQIRVASEYLEAICWRTFMTTTWTAVWDGGFRNRVFLPRPPLLAITSVHYINGAGVSTELTSAGYAIKYRGDLPYLVPTYGTSWPSVRSDADVVTIVFTAGYGANRRDVPLGIRDAIAIVAAARVRSIWTGCEEEALPRAARQLLTDYDVVDEAVLRCL